MFYTEGALSLPVRPGNMGFLIYRDGYSIFLDICNSGKSRKGWWLGYFLINWKKDYYFFAGSPREVPPWIFRVYGSMARSAGRIYRAGYLLLQFNVLVMNLLCNYYRRAGNPRPLSIADFRLPRTHVVLVHASIARGIIWVRIKKSKIHFCVFCFFCLFFWFFSLLLLISFFCFSLFLFYIFSAY